MLSNIFLENIVIISPLALVIYLLLAIILGWVLRAVIRRRYWHRFWEHKHYPKKYHRYPKKHTYVEYVPELRRYRDDGGLEYKARKYY